MKAIHLLVAGVALGATGTAQAAITTYSTQASFLAAAGTTGTDTFNDLAPTATPGPLSRTAGVYGYTASTGPNSTDFFPGTDDGVDIFLSTNNRLDPITAFAFTGGVRAAGGLFFGSDLFGESTPAASLTLTATDASGTVTQILLNPTTTTFFGFTSTTGLLNLTVSAGDQAGVWPSINNLVLGNGVGGAVPEPAAWALMIAGFGLAGTAMRRRAKTTVAFA